MTTGVVVADGVRTRYAVSGRGSPVVLVHGTGAHLEVWSRVVPLLAGRFTCVTYDLIGHGWSGDIDRDLTIDDYAGQLRSLIDALDIRRPVVVGHSLGAGVAIRTAVSIPEAVAGVGAVSGTGRPPPPEQARRLADDSEAAARNPSPETVRKRLASTVLDPATIEDLVESRTQILRRPGAVARTNRAVARLRTTRSGEPPRELWRDLARLEVPLFVVWGDSDPVSPLAYARELAASVPGSRCTVIGSCGHLPQYEQPAALADAIASSATEYTAEQCHSTITVDVPKR